MPKSKKLIVSKPMTISSKFQVSIPRQIVREMKLKPTDKFVFVFDPKNGKYYLDVIQNPVLELRGIFKGMGYSSDDFIRERKEEDEKRTKKLMGLI
jgi:bifunctional DNA-binding transcriptional regulator/antitoxin component of YhaV-PrlF toxin-antitoxin module